jgi:hypothetical protein
VQSGGRVPVRADGPAAPGPSALRRDEGPTTADRPVARVGDELAASRALYALADRLMEVTAEGLALAAGSG